MHQAMAHGFDTNEVVMYSLMSVTGSRRLNCYRKRARIAQNS